MRELILARLAPDEGQNRHAIESALFEARRSLSETGSLFLLSGWNDSYALKRAADEIFGAELELRNEIIWVVRQTRPGHGTHDRHFTLFWYVRDRDQAPFHQLTMPKSVETRKRFGDGRIISSKSQRTGRRAPTRVEGASTEAPLNDVWVLDLDRMAWVYDLEEMEGATNGVPHTTGPYRKPSDLESVSIAEQTLEVRLQALTGHTGVFESLINKPSTNDQSTAT